MQYEALDPRGEKPAICRAPLATRLKTLDDRRVTIVLTMPPGSGLEEVEALVRDELHANAPRAMVTTFRRADFMIDDPVERSQLAARCEAAIIIVGPAATMCFVAAVYGGHLEAAGLPVVLVIPPAVRIVAEHSTRSVGVPVRVVESYGDVVGALTDPLLEEERIAGIVPPAPRPAVACRGTLRQVQQHFTAEGWTDGLPIVPPTAEALDEMLGGTSRKADELVTETLRPEGLPARVRDVAIAAVMAGAFPEQLPVILAASGVLGDIEFQSMTRSVNSFAFAYLVNGPVASQARMTGGLGAIGPGNEGNATVGRALGLLTRTVGGARLGVTSTPTIGNPAAWAFAFAENESASPWSPVHTSYGFDAGESAVSVFSGGWSHLGNFYYEGVGGILSAASNIDSLTGVLLLVSAKRAAALASEGWTREGLGHHIWQGVTRPLGELRSSGFFPMMKATAERSGGSRRGPARWPASYLTDPPEKVVPRFPREGVCVAVVGGDVSHSMQLWALTHHVTVSVEPWR